MGRLFMTGTLDILIPHYHESPEEMTPLLDSLAVQQGVDLDNLGVIIAYDGPDATPLPVGEWAERYPFKITHTQGEKAGVSATRNLALDTSEAEYVMFCDADDMFCDVCGLFIIFREMGIGEFDTLMSRFREQTKDQDGNMTFIDHETDQTFVHGKVHRRQYLIDKGIRFNPKLTIHEDSFFNIQCQALADPERAKYCPTAFYLWRWRENSVCRHDKDYILKTFVNMLDSNDALIGEFVKRMRNDLANQYVGFMVWDSYYTMNKPDWRNKVNKGYRDKTERRFAAYFKKHKEQWDALTEQEKMIISNGVRQRSVMEGMLIEELTITQWLRRIEKMNR